MHCELFEVSHVEDDGSLSKVECYSSLNDAKNKMKENRDYVVRNGNSLSPTKIIAMNSGLAYSYPGRSGSITMNLYEHVTDRSIVYKQTYITNHYEMTYIDTPLVTSNGGRGMIQIVMNGFKGYCDLEYTDLVPSKYLEKSIPIFLGGNNSYEGEDAFQVIPRQSYFIVKKNGNYSDLEFHYYRAYPSNGTLEPVSSTLRIGPGCSFMKENVKYYSNDAINFYSDPDLKNFVGMEYNYYQFLPLRSKTNISGDTLNEYLKSKGYKENSKLFNEGNTFINAQNTYGCNGLLVYCLAIHESAYGTSGYATKRNNLFGWNAVDADPSQASYFANIEQAVNEHMGVNLRGYLDITDGRFFNSSLGNKGSGFNVKYASDPYWGLKIATYCYEIDKFSCGKNGNLTDYDNYSLALIKNFDVAVKQKADASSKTLYTTGYGGDYQQDFLVITLGEEGGYTKIQSTNAIDASGNIKTHRTPITTGNLNPISDYDYNMSVAYVKTSDLLYLNREVEVANDPVVCNVLSSLYDVSFLNEGIHLKGFALLEGVDFANASGVSHSVMLYDYRDSDKIYAFEAKTIDSEGVDLNDGVNYKYSGFEITIPYSDIPEGNYYLKVKVNNGVNTGELALRTSSDAYSLLSNSINDTTYRLSTNSLYNYRLELDKMSSPLDYSKINKPSARTSLQSFDDITIDESLNLKINGVAFMYYLDYANKSDVSYDVYLVGSKDNYRKLDTKLTACPLDYKAVINSSRNLDNVCFEADGNIADLESGEYQIVIETKNGSYLDYLELTNRSEIETPAASVGNRNYSIQTSDVRHRVVLDIEG